MDKAEDESRHKCLVAQEFRVIHRQIDPPKMDEPEFLCITRNVAHDGWLGFLEKKTVMQAQRQFQPSKPGKQGWSISRASSKRA